MDESLLKKTVVDELAFTDLYNMNRMFYVAFFGGIIPTAILLRKNAEDLKIKQSVIQIMTLVAIAYMIGKIWIAGMAVNSQIAIEMRTLRYIFRAVVLVYYAVYYWLMKKTYMRYKYLGSEDKPLLKPAIGYTLIGIVVETFVITIGAEVIKNGLG